MFSPSIEILSLSVRQCLELLNDDSDIQLIDVRREDEYNKVSIPNSMHLELAKILAGQWKSLIPCKERGLILYCHSGIRSMKAGQYLLSQGFTKLWNMEGGIEAYLHLQ